MLQREAVAARQIRTDFVVAAPGKKVHEKYTNHRVDFRSPGLKIPSHGQINGQTHFTLVPGRRGCLRGRCAHA